MIYLNRIKERKEDWQESYLKQVELREKFKGQRIYRIPKGGRENSMFVKQGINDKTIKILPCKTRAIW